MSIVALKRKTYAQYHNNSVNGGFSLNGTHRNQGYIGQTSLSRSFPRTPMKGNTPKGHGGCCGKYPTGNIIQSGVTSLEDTSVIKPSVKSTRGMLDTKYRWIRRPYPYAVTESANRLNSQENYIYYVRQKTLSATDADGTPCYSDNKEKEVVYSKCGNVSGVRAMTVCDTTATETESKTKTYENYNEYIYNLDKKCTEVIQLQSSTTRAPTTCA
jgi:hypothetical protein